MRVAALLPAAALVAAAFAVPAGASADTQSVSIEQSAFTPPADRRAGGRHGELAQRQPARPHRHHPRRQLRLARPHRARRLLLGVVRERRRLSLLLHDPSGNEGRGRRLPRAAGRAVPRGLAGRPDPADRPSDGGHQHRVDRARLRGGLRPGGDRRRGRDGHVQGRTFRPPPRRSTEPWAQPAPARPCRWWWSTARSGWARRAGSHKCTCRRSTPARPWCCRCGCASASAGSPWRSASSTVTRTPASPIHHPGRRARAVLVLPDGYTPVAMSNSLRLPRSRPAP